MITTYNDSPPTIITLLHPRRCKLAIPPIFIVIPLTCSPPSPSSLLFIASTTLVQLCGVNEFDDRQLQNQSRILIRNERGKWEQFHQHTQIWSSKPFLLIGLAHGVEQGCSTQIINGPKKILGHIQGPKRICFYPFGRCFFKPTSWIDEILGFAGEIKSFRGPNVVPAGRRAYSGKVARKILLSVI